jgi:hypothetical protein
MTNQSTINTDCRILFSRLNAMLSEQGSMEVPGGVTIERIALRGDASKLFADADVVGLYTGSAILHFTPGYNQATKMFTVHDVGIELPEDNMFAKFAGKMINNLLGDKLDQKIQELINAKFQMILEEILTQLKSVEFPNGGTLYFDTKSWQLSGLRTSAEGLHFIAELTGDASLEY